MQLGLPFQPGSCEPGTWNQEPGTSFVFVRHPRARRYVVRVRDDGTVHVTIPRGGSKREATAFAQEQQSWIEKQLRRVEEERATPREMLPPTQYIRDTVFFPRVLTSLKSAKRVASSLSGLLLRPFVSWATKRAPAAK